MSSKKTFDTLNDAIKAAKEVNILKFAQANGYDFKKMGKNRYNGIQHGSLTITPSLNRFFYFSGNFGGDTIAFAQKMMGITDFKQAVEFINSNDYERFDHEAFKNLKINNKPYIYDASKESKNFLLAYNYLVNERKITSEVVRYLHKNGLIRQDKKGNIIFPYIKDLEIVGAARQGTYTKSDGSTFKQIEENSDGTHGFNYLNGLPKHLKFFESPIDLLSYLSIHQDNLKKINNTWFICMHGLKESVVQNYFKQAQAKLTKEKIKQMLNATDVDFEIIHNSFKEKGVNPKSIQNALDDAGLAASSYATVKKYVMANLQSVFMCVDNDEKGITFAMKIQKAMKMFDYLDYQFEIPTMPTTVKATGLDKWDWNDELKFHLGKLAMAKNQVEHDFIEVQADDYLQAELIDDNEINEIALNTRSLTHQMEAVP